MFEQFLPQRDPVGIVHREDFDCRSALGGLSDQERTFPSKMSRPSLKPGIEESRELLCDRIDPGQIRSLVEVTSQTAIGEIGETTAARVLPCDDMLDLIRRENVGFGKMAVFATIARPRANRLSEQFVHAYDLPLSDEAEKGHRRPSHRGRALFARRRLEPPRGYSGPGRSCGPCPPRQMSVQGASGRFRGRGHFSEA